MAIQTGLVLKSYFKTGDIPTGQNFTDLIDTLFSMIPSSYLDADTALTANSDLKIATQKAVKAYIDNLIAVLSATKQATLVSGTSIKSINGTSLLGAGNLTITGGGLADNEYSDFANLAVFPISGETDALYLAKDTGKFYFWDGAVYVAQTVNIGSVSGLSTALSLKADQTAVTLNTNNIATNATAIALKADKSETRTIAGSGTSTVTFDKRFYSEITQIGNIILNVSTTGNVNNTDALIVVDANDTGTFILGAGIILNTGSFQNLKRNRIWIQYSKNEAIVNINNFALPDTFAPIIISFATNSSGTNATLVANKTLGSETLTFKKNGIVFTPIKTITGSSVIVTLSNIFGSDVLVANGTISDTANPQNTLTLTTDYVILNNSTPYTAYDNFNSANVASIAGRITPVGGFPWSKTAGDGTLGISNNRLKLTSGALTDAEYVFDPGKRNVDLSVSIPISPGSTSDGLILFLYTGKSPSFNYCYITPNYEIKMWTNSVNSTIYAGDGSTWASGDVVRIVVTNTTLTLYKNGVQLFTGAAANGQPGQKVGAYIYRDNTTEFDEFKII